MTQPAQNGRKKTATKTATRSDKAQALCQHRGQRTTKAGRVITFSQLVQWGDDKRYQRCRHCGAVVTRDLPPEATTPRTKRQARAKRAAAASQPPSLWSEEPTSK